jgi:hypothetical protein
MFNWICTKSERETEGCAIMSSESVRACTSERMRLPCGIGVEYSEFNYFQVGNLGQVECEMISFL